MKKVVCFGEVLLRLGAEGKEPLFRSATLRADFCGAEANVAVSLAHFGLESALVSVLPDNAVGDAGLGELRRHGVDTVGVKRSAGRMGLYFLSPGALLRPAQVTYDRANSAFAHAPASSYDWSTLLAGAGWLHVSGITPALSKTAEESLLAATETAGKLGVPISFDCNYRPALWRGREKDAPGVLRALVERATLVFGGVRDVAHLFGVDHISDEPEAAFQKGASVFFAKCPTLKYLAATHRVVHGAEHNDLTAFLADRSGSSKSRPLTLNPIVDRIGSGDAFAAGVLYGLCQNFDRQRTVDFALAAAALKHSLPGDFNLSSAEQVFQLLQSANRDVGR